MMIEPQRLEYVETDLAPPAIIAHFQDHSASIDFPVEKVNVQYKCQKHLNNTCPAYYR